MGELRDICEAGGGPTARLQVAYVVRGRGGAREGGAGAWSYASYTSSLNIKNYRINYKKIKLAIVVK